MPNSIDNQPQILPLLALRGLVVFPNTMVHFDVSRPKSIAAINRAMERDQTIFLISQRNIREDEPGAEDLYEIGTVAKIRQILRLPDQNVRILVEGQYRAKCDALINTAPYFTALVERCIDKVPRVRALYRETLVRRLRASFEHYSEVSTQIAPDIALNVASSEDPGYLADFITSSIPVPPDDKQFILEELGPIARAKAVLQMLEREIQILELDKQIGEKVKVQMDENQREYYLREQLRAINTELYGENEGEDEIEEYLSKIDALNAPEEIKQKLYDEVNKLAKMPQGSHEGTVVRGYLDTCLALPWNVYTTSKIDLSKAEKILDRDFYGMKPVKERILEMLAVYALAPKISGQIICLVGPPGVGKTSIARSIAECMGRKFARISLGGVHDEAEIRGHRRTYVGAMPGKILQAVEQAGSSNPLILLDEIDKLGGDFRGDPASALLEVLDGEQNSTFRDHFLDLPYDLSQVVFLTTANTLETIPAPLLDRLEVIELSSYTREEKFQIAKQHLLKKELKRHGLRPSTCKICDDTLYALIDFYTREAGVRKLERSIATLCRKAAKEIVAGKNRVTIHAEQLEALLGVKKYRPDLILPQDEVGVINGLAWTSVGGELMRMEVAVVEGSGKLELTGSLGDVMQESARAAVTYVRSRAKSFGISPTFYKDMDIHIHATEAAVPKDGPSAGVTIVTALVSALTGRPIRRDIAMTGEVTVRGRVLAIGGLKEKTMAAYRAGVTTVFLPKENEPDLAEIDETVRGALHFVPVSTVDEILPQALLPLPVGSQEALRPELCENHIGQKAAKPVAIVQ